MVNEPSARAQIRCRRIEEHDIGAVVDLLVRGFPVRNRDYWLRGLRREAERRLPPNCPRYGYLLEHAGMPVGVILVLSAPMETGGIRCNLSSWYVEPEFRGHASFLIAYALRNKQATYVNISPARHTWSTIEAQGFKRYCSGQLFAIPALSGGGDKAELRQVAPGAPVPGRLSEAERDLLAQHAAYGCLSLVCAAADGDHPFVFLPFRIRRFRISLPCMHLVYCWSIDDFVRFARPLGRFLLKRRTTLVALDDNGPVEGLVGTYREGRVRKYYKGTHPPRLGDLAYTELVLFGP
jgi:hypothetical protein